MMGYAWTNLSAAPVGDANGYLIAVDMKVGAYTLDATAPTFGARHVTCTRTRDGVGGTEDTGGTLDLVGRDASGATITETLTVGANITLVTSTKFFAHLDGATGVGWEVDAGAGKDHLEIGWDAECAVATGSGVFHGLFINATANGAIVVADARGTIATIPANAAVGFWGPYDVNYSGFLRIEPAAASNITVMHTGSMPGTYLM
jgi:hypothetical protein